MPSVYQPYTLALICAALLSMALVAWIFKHPSTLGTRSFALLTGAIAMWSFLSVFEVIAQDIPTKQFSGSLKYLFIVIVPAAWFTFGLFYAGRMQRMRPGALTLLMVVPLTTLGMISTNGYHHLMFTHVDWRMMNGLLLPVRTYGPWFWIHTAYSYALLLLGFFYLTRSVIDSQLLFRRQTVALIITALAPWLCNMQFLFGPALFPHPDLTPLSFSISSLAVMWGILRYRLVDILPIARDRIIENLIDGILVLDNNGRILDHNPAVVAQTGLTQHDLIGCQAEQVIPWWSDLPTLSQLEGMDQPIVIEVQGADHRVRLIHLSAATLRNKEKRIGSILTLRDVTALKKVQDALRQSEARFKSLSENAPVVIIALDQEGLISYINPAWQTILGHERLSSVGKPLSQFLTPEVRRICNEDFDHLISGRRQVVERQIQIAERSGSLRKFAYTAAANADEEGRITGIIVLAKDITEEDQLQFQLFQSQKMEAIGTLAGGIAHDFNNLLMGMQANVSLLRLNNQPPSAHEEKLRRIEDQIQSGAALTRQLLGYARRGKYQVDILDIHKVIEETLNIVQRTNKDILVQRFPNADPSFMAADQGQMELVLLNLFVNAMDAMANGGRLRVCTRHLRLPEADTTWPDAKPGAYIEISVADTGVGMDRATLARIFEPFFTTKEIGQGTGLGLASVYGVVKNHGGFIHIDSEPGRGTDVRLLFAASPARIQPTGTIAETDDQRPLSPKALRVLIVDDEPPILDSVKEMVESLGFTVTATQKAREALDIFQQAHETIDLVMLDMVMPEMDGAELFQRLREIDSDIKVIIISGYGRNKIPS
ncbi:MAG: PAS domain S-box protein, partial [Desulfatitalea sp.]|nr:PAS domain S-box protein [Desulfatitalea sp.]NNJ99373.1 PAS domain S-box protein [Desulfatitalea sp.]